MRKTVSILLVFFFLYSMVGYHLWFVILQYNIQEQVKQEIRSELNEEDLSIIVVSEANQSEIHWIKPDKEFEINGEMYDIVKEETGNDLTTYYCINDVKEKLLIANYNKGHNSRREAEKRLKRPLNSKYFPGQYQILNHLCMTRINYASSVFHYLSSVIQIPSPPPKSV